MHLTEAQVQDLLDSELGSELGPATQEHLAGCAECRGRVTMARAEEEWLARTLRPLDRSPPALTAGDLVAVRRSRARAQIAAGLALLLGLGGVAYAAPGSPLPRLLARAAALVTPDRRMPHLPSIEKPGAAESQSGVALDPGERFTVELPESSSLISVVVSLTDSPELVVRARGGTTSFSSEVDRLVVRHADQAAALEIEVPRSAPLVQLRQGNTSLWRKQRDRISSSSAAGLDGRYHFAFPQP